VDGEWACGCTLRLLTKNQLIRLVAVAALGLGLGACQPDTATSETSAARGSAAAPVLTPGPWRGVLAVQGQEIPFLFEVDTLNTGKQLTVTLINGEQRQTFKDIHAAADSTIVRFGTRSALVLRADSADVLKGFWIRHDAKTTHRVPVVAYPNNIGSTLFFSEATMYKPVVPILGMGGDKQSTFGATFTNAEGKPYSAVGLFKYDKFGTVNGTLLTTTGDHHYLAGDIVTRQNQPMLMLSAFDGNQLLLLTAKLVKVDLPSLSVSELMGDFYSSKCGHQTWNAVLEPNTKLPKS